MEVEEDEWAEVSFFLRDPRTVVSEDLECLLGSSIFMEARSSLVTLSGTRMSHSSWFTVSSASKVEVVCFLALYNEKSLGGL